MQRLILPVLAMAVLMAGCGSTPRLIPAPSLSQEIGSEIKSIPAIGVIHSVEIGENLYSEYTAKTTRTYSATLMEDAYGEMDLGNKISRKRGTTGPLTKTYGDKFNALCFDFGTSSVLTGSSHACLVDKGGNGIFDHSMFKNRDRYFPLINKAKYARTANEPTFSIDESKFKRTALYQGISKGSIKISFREFVNDMARPAFTQDVSYDLQSDGTTSIAFKGLRIEVISARGPNIEYKVLKPFSDSLAN